MIIFLQSLHILHFANFAKFAVFGVLQILQFAKFAEITDTLFIIENVSIKKGKILEIKLDQLTLH